MKKILFVPIDNRPITYTLTKDIAAIYEDINLIMPERNLLGGLKTHADTEKITGWLKDNNGDLIILSLDTIAYGGLVASRRCPETYDEIKTRLENLKKILLEKKETAPDTKIFATSSIMRISNNNENEEEKEYWSQWGKRIFAFSYYQHKSRVLQEYNCVYNQVPDYILNDYLETRKRNFEINKLYIEWLKEGLLDYMIYSKDDTGEYGLNVEEANELQKITEKEKLNAIVKTGADEIPLALLTRGITKDTPLKIQIKYSNPNSTDKISRYEDISVSNCVESQIKIGIKNAQITNDNPDVTVYVNNFANEQGDLVFQDVVNSSNVEIDFETPIIIADINNANGSDSGFVENVLKKELNENLLSYSGYNTSANSIGSALCIGVTAYLAKKTGGLNKEAFKKLLAIRFLDDWAYQANIRKNIQGSENFKKSLEENIDKLLPYEEKINKFLNANYKPKYSLPWNRSFEAEIEV